MLVFGADRRCRRELRFVSVVHFFYLNTTGVKTSRVLFIWPLREAGCEDRDTPFGPLDASGGQPLDSSADDVAIARQWTRDIGVASIPLSVFCKVPMTGTRLRFCFAKDDTTLAEAVDRLSAL